MQPCFDGEAALSTCLVANAFRVLSATGLNVHMDSLNLDTPISGIERYFVIGGLM